MEHQPVENPSADPYVASLNQLHGQRSRLRRELSEVRATSAASMNLRTRLLREISRVEQQIRETSATRLRTSR